MSSPRALSSPPESLIVLGEEHVERALAASRTSERKRIILPFHKSDDALLHRMFNAMQPGTYVQPHRHLHTQKSEIFLVLRGALDFLVFDDVGSIRSAVHLRAGGSEFGIDLAPGDFHSFLVRERDTLVYEVKQGPYTAADDKDFASWAPAEGDAGVADYVRELEQALRGCGLRDYPGE